MLALLLSPIGKALGAVALAAALLGGVYLYGYQRGEQAARVEQLQDTVQAYLERNRIDDEVDAADRYAVCVELGGMPDDCARLRGVDETAQGK